MLEILIRLKNDNNSNQFFSNLQNLFQSRARYGFFGRSLFRDLDPCCDAHIIADR